MYNGKEIKQYENVKYFGCTLDQSLSRDSMAFTIIDKVNLCLKFLHKIIFKTPFGRLSCNALIQNFFDYACTAWFSNLS